MWVSTQRKDYSKEKLSDTRRDALNSVGFDFDPHETAWIRMYENLVDYQKREGHCLVPTSEAKLGKWVSTQRTSKASGMMDPRHEQLLNEIGFLWSVTKSTSKRDKAQENNS